MYICILYILYNLYILYILYMLYILYILYILYFWHILYIGGIFIFLEFSYFPHSLLATRRSYNAPGRYLGCSRGTGRSCNAPRCRLCCRRATGRSCTAPSAAACPVMLLDAVVPPQEPQDAPVTLLGAAPAGAGATERNRNAPG